MAADSANVSSGLATTLTNSPASGSANMAALPASLRPLLLLIGIAAAVAAGVWIVLWSKGPTFSLLSANLSPQDEAQIAQALDAAQIPYKLDSAASGIEVPAERLDEARLKLAGQGLTDNDSFAALEKSSGFGVSQFMEDVRYQHALEMELARTIASLQPVAGARVNLAEPRQSVFVSDNRSASASVFVELKPGATLESEQVQAIANLVASSVPNLSPGAVTVVDQQGRLLSAPNGHDPYAMDERQYDMVHRMETDYDRRIEALLTPLVGAGLVHAQVVAELNLGSSEQAKELYTPNSQIVRSEQLSEQSGGGAASGGVPGSLSNEPPTPGVAVPQSLTQSSAPAGQNGSAASGTSASATAASGPGAQNTSQTGAAGTPAGASGHPPLEPVGGTFGMPGDKTISRDVTRNYEIDRTLNYSSQPAGTVRRLTVAVLIGDRTVTGPDGKTKKVPLSSDDLTRVTQLVKDAVGYDASRGDSVSVLNEPLDTGSAPTTDGSFQAPPLWQSPFAWTLLRIVAGFVVVLVLVLSVLRPLVKSLIIPMRLAPAAAQALPAGTPGAPALPPGQREGAGTPISHEQQLSQARTLVNQDPKRVAQVVRGWVGSDE